MIYRFHFWERVYFANRDSRRGKNFPSQSDEKSGRFLGLSEDVGHQMTTLERLLLGTPHQLQTLHQTLTLLTKTLLKTTIPPLTSLKTTIQMIIHLLMVKRPPRVTPSRLPRRPLCTPRIDHSLRSILTNLLGVPIYLHLKKMGPSIVCKLLKQSMSSIVNEILTQRIFVFEPDTLPTRWKRSSPTTNCRTGLKLRTGSTKYGDSKTF